MITFNQALLGACRQPESRPDIVQLVTNLRPRAIPWLIRLRMLGIPTVYAVTLAPINTSKKLSKRILRQLSWRQLYNRLDCIITNNETLRDMVRGFGVTTPIEVIPNGVDLKRFYPQPGGSDRNRVRVSLGIGASDPVICTVGAVIPRKGTDVLVEAWLNVLRRFPRTHLLVIGPQTHLEHPKLGWFRSRIENAVRKSGMPKRIHFTGIVDDVAAHLRASDIFVLASDLEGMPNSVLEAMATSLPVIMTPFVGLSQDLGTPGRHFFLSQKDIDALAKHLEELLENREYRLQLGERGRQWVTDTLDIESSLDQYASLYHELVLRTRANTAT